MRAVIAVVALLAVAAGVPGTADAAAPRIILVSGGMLPRQVVISDRYRIARFVILVTAAPFLPRAELANRPRLRLSLFWRARLGAPRSLLPAQADQHGSYYPAYGARAAAIELPWAGRWPRAVPEKAVRILARLGVPVRVALPAHR